MKILITGSSGMLGMALGEELSVKHEVVGLDIRQGQLNNFIHADITQRDEIVEKIASQKPEIVVHCAAYTDVDGCERNPEKSQTINALGTQNVALACKESSSLLIYISTDFVFDGRKKTAYIESDRPNPLNVYGRSKLKGEEFVQTILEKSIIIRSSWLFGRGGINFVDTLLNKAKNKKEIEVVNDQFGSPTYVKDIASAISRLINLIKQPNGIYHITNSGNCCWYELALAIKDIAGLDIQIMPIASKQYPSPTTRPKMSILENRRYQECTGQSLRPWQDALKEYLVG